MRGMLRTFTSLIFCLVSIIMEGRSDVELIAGVVGAVSVEDVTEDMFHHYGWYLRHPLKLNYAGRRALEESRLFNEFQIASFLEYRDSNGDIYSLLELASIYGFTQEIVTKLAPFISVESHAVGAVPSRPPLEFNHELETKVGTRINFPSPKGNNPDNSLEYGIKYHMDMSARGGLFLNFRKTISQKKYDFPGFTFYYKGARSIGNLILGNFSARFGQGLALWSGFTMSGVTRASNLQKKGSVIAPSFTTSNESALHGLAASFYAGDFTISTFAAVDDYSSLFKQKGSISLIPGFMLAWSHPFGTLSLGTFLQTSDLRHPVKSHPSQVSKVRDSDFHMSRFQGNGIQDWKVSMAFSGHIKGTVVYAETALNILNLPGYSVAAGTNFRIGEGVEMSCQLRSRNASFSKVDEHAFVIISDVSRGPWITPAAGGMYAMASRKHQLSVFSDFGLSDVSKTIQFRLSPDYRLLINSFWYLSSRLTLRLKCQPHDGAKRGMDIVYRIGARAETGFSDGQWLFKTRLEIVQGHDFGAAGFCEGGYKRGMVSTYLRICGFGVKNWDDRIYVYDRDAPGSFSNQIAYGRGAWLTSYTALDFYPFRGKLYFKLSVRLSRKWHPQPGDSPGFFRAKIQYNMTF